ncbi:MAG: PLP-dependent aminotransferase family protein [Lentisphaeria bacterium]|nr:PLP-dependent aminotransferase family protein [Lentisphaeria bacterium]
MPVNSFRSGFLSWMPEAARLGRPRYLSLAHLLENDIRSGRLAPGAKLPPQRELADYLDLNFTTVTRAYDLCREKRLIYGVTGRGTFVSPLPGVREAEISGGDALIELGVVKGFDYVGGAAVAAAARVLGKGYLHRLNSHAAVSGHLHQRAAAVNYLAGFGVATDEEHTALFSGAQNAISAALLSLFTIGDTLAVDEFTYANLIGTAHLAHLRLLPVPGDGGGMDPDALTRCCERDPVAGIFLMPNCANPTTLTLSEERKAALAEVIRRYDLTLIEDDPACLPPQTPGARTLFSRLPERTVYISGALKYLSPWLRVAVAAFPERFRQRLLNGLFLLNIKTSALDAEIVTELLQSGRAAAILREKRALAVRANRIFDRIFPSDSSGDRDDFFRVLPLPDRFGGQVETEAFFAARGVRVQHSSRFAVRPRPERNFLRVSVSSAGSERALRVGLTALRFALAER